jgi:NADH-quinone oxidoreductase subunit L
MMLVGTLALTGFPPFAGYFSKDAIIEAAYVSHRPAALYGFLTTVIAAGLTSFYSWRLVFLTFFDVPRQIEGSPEDIERNAHDEPVAGDQHAHPHEEHSVAELHGHHAHHGGDHHHAPHESPNVMLVPLYVLAAGALLAGMIFKHWFIGTGAEGFWKEALFFASNNHVMEDAESGVPFGISILPTLMMLLGFAVALYMYVLAPGTAQRLAERNRPLYLFLLNKWYFDELYNVLFVRPAFWLGRLFWRGGDGRIIDGFGPNGVAQAVVDVTNRVVKIQTGFVFHYAFAMMLGVAAFITWYLVGGIH